MREWMSERIIMTTKFLNNIDYYANVKVEEVRIKKLVEYHVFINLLFWLDVLGEDGETNDLLLAQMLQLEFDKEYDGFVKSKEKVFNQNSNGKPQINLLDCSPFKDQKDNGGHQCYW